MAIEHDRDYITFLRCLRQSDNSFMLQTHPDGASSPIRVKYETINGDSERGSARLGTNSVRSKRQRRKEKKDKKNRGLCSCRRKVVFRSSSGRVYDCQGLRKRDCVPPCCNCNIQSHHTSPNSRPEPDKPRIDDIPLDVVIRPPSDYKDRLIKELKRPFDKCEYRELINMASFRKKKFITKELRPKENALKEGATPMIRERVVETQEYSKSFFDFYPEVENKVKRAKPGRGLALLRGLFFWLQSNATSQPNQVEERLPCFIPVLKLDQ